MNVPLLLISLSLPVLITGGTIGSPNLILAAGAMYVIGMAWGVLDLFIREVLGIRKSGDL